MRRLAFLVGSVPLLAAAVFACEEDQSGGGPQLDFDSGPLDANRPPFDGAPGFDANVPDAPPDAPVARDVTVVVTTGGRPKPNARVVFHDASGAVLETKETGVDGKATSTGAVPAMASVVLGTSTLHHILTWTAIEAGDVLQARDIDESDDVLGDYRVTLPALDDGGAVRFHAATGDCQQPLSPGESGLLTIRRHCIGMQGAVLGMARDQADELVGVTFKKGNAVPSDAGALDVALPAWTAPTPFSLSVTSPSDDLGFAATLDEIVHGIAFSQEAFRGDGTSYPFRIAPSFAEALQATVYFDPFSGSRRTITKRIAPAASLAIDPAEALAPITEAAIDASNARRPKVTWETAGVANTDGGLVQLRYYGPADADFFWTLVVPPGSLTATAPAMPAELDGLLPEADAGPSVYWPPEVHFVETDLLANYAAFRRQPALLPWLDRGYLSGIMPVLPANGTFRVTSHMPVPR